MIYERYHTRQIDDFGGLARRAAAAGVSSPCCCAFPASPCRALNGFAGEFLLLLGMFQRGWAQAGAGALPLRIIAVASLAGVVLGAWYVLWMYQRVSSAPSRAAPWAAAIRRFDPCSRKRPTRRQPSAGVCRAAGRRSLAARNPDAGAAGGDDLLDRALAAVLR